jgi:hypothetical protein
VSQYILRFRGFARRPSWCHAIVAHDDHGQKAVLVGELDDNPGTSTINAIEQVGEAIAEHLLSGNRSFALYQYVPKGLPDLEPTFYRVEWNGQPGSFSMPTWKVVVPQGDPWLRHLRNAVRDHDYTFDSLSSERDLELIDATREPEDLRWAM